VPVLDSEGLISIDGSTGSELAGPLLAVPCECGEPSGSWTVGRGKHRGIKVESLGIDI
jgi:hypothetical protein